MIGEAQYQIKAQISPQNGGGNKVIEISILSFIIVSLVA
jgi:hypothetical protein